MDKLSTLSDRELLLSVAQDVRDIRLHLAIQNDRLSKAEAALQTQALGIAGVSGAISFGRWAIAVLIGLMSLGTAAAGSIITIIARS